MFGMSMGELVLVMVLALIFIGPKNLPKAMRTLGRMYGWARHHLAVMQREINAELRRMDLEEAEKAVGPNVAPVPDKAPLSPRRQAQLDAEREEAADPGPAYDTDAESDDGPIAVSERQARVLHDVPGLHRTKSGPDPAPVDEEADS